MRTCACDTVFAVTDLARLEPAVELLKALAAPVRLALVAELAAGPRCVHELVERLGVSQPLTSQHLRVLRGAGLVTAGRRGREVEYALADEHVAHVVRDLLEHAAEPVPASPHRPDPPHEESA
jgi:ArsR family transcriptional regulator, zinc-responsive transcriptional repressor